MEFDAIRGHCLNAMNHIRSARRIIHERGANSNSMSAKLAAVGVDYITDSMARTSLNDELTSSVNHDNEQTQALALSSFCEFTSLDQASSYLEELIKERRSIQSLLMQTSEVVVDGVVRGGTMLSSSMQQCLIYLLSRTVKIETRTQTRIDTLFRGYVNWKAAFHELMEHRNQQEYTGRTVLLLRIWFFVSEFSLSTMRETREIACDRFADDFDRTLDFIDLFQKGTNSSRERMHWPGIAGRNGYRAGVFESGILSALFLICCKCRMPTRWLATQKLYNAKRAETIYTSESLAMYAKTLIKLEEDAANGSREASSMKNGLEALDVPERARISDAIFSTESQGASLTIVTARVMHENQGSVELVEHEVRQSLDGHLRSGGLDVSSQDSELEIKVRNRKEIALVDVEYPASRG